MNKIEDFLARFGSLALGLLILRLVVGLLMLVHGYLLLKNGLGFVEMLLQKHSLPTFIAYGAYVGEIIAPIFIIAGLWTRIAALILAINMAFTIFLAHMHQLFVIGKYGMAIELNYLYLFLAIAIIFTGSGRFSVRSS